MSLHSVILIMLMRLRRVNIRRTEHLSSFLWIILMVHVTTYNTYCIKEGEDNSFYGDSFCSVRGMESGSEDLSIITPWVG